MLKKALVVVAASCLLSGHVDAADYKAEAEKFFNALCVKTDQYHGTCEEEQREFVKNYEKAFRGEYTPQRNVAFMLSTGSGGALQKNAVQSCAWRMVVLQSGHPDVYQGDTEHAERTCERLSATERTAASARTVAIMGQIAVARGRK